MSSKYMQTLDMIIKMEPVLQYIQEMKHLSKCYGPIIERDAVLSGESMIVIHFLVSSSDAYKEAYTLRHKHIMHPMMNVCRQVTIAKEIKPEWCNTDMEVFVQEYSESMKTNEDDNEVIKESLFFAYHDINFDAAQASNMIIGTNLPCLRNEVSHLKEIPCSYNQMFTPVLNNKTVTNEKMNFISPDKEYLKKMSCNQIAKSNIEHVFDSSNLPLSSWYPKAGSKFKNWATMQKVLESYSSRNHFSFGRKCSYFNEKRSLELFHSKDPVMQRGYLYCRHKHYGSNSCCSWKIKYTYAHSKQCYVIKDDSIFYHNHDLKDDYVVHERKYVKYEKELTSEELLHLEDIGKFQSYSMAKVLETMENKFMKRAFDRNLLKRIISKVKDCEYGPDRHRLPDLFEMAKKHHVGGGVYKIGNDPDTFRLNKFILQTFSMRCYARMYSDFTSIDYTHAGNKYNLLTCIPTGIDCLGKSVFFGIAINKSENLNDVSEAIDVLGLNSHCYSEGVIMHDDGSAFEGLSEKYSMKNILCTKHVAMNADKASGGIGVLHEMFHEVVNNILYFPFFSSDENLVNYIISMRSKCEQIDHIKAVTFLNGLIRNRKKVAAFHTSKHFTAQQRANTRGEGTHSRFKGNGDLKKELLHADLVRSVNRIIHISEYQDQQSIIEITKCIERNMDWSFYVESFLNKSLVDANNIFDVELVESLSNGNEKWNVRKTIPQLNGEYKSKLTSVFVPGAGSSQTNPICLNCEIYMSSWLPCPCIAAVFGRKKHKFKHVKNLHPYWRLSNHPLWAAAHKKLGIQPPMHHANKYSITADNISTAFATKHSDMGIDKEMFASIQYPKEENVRVARLREKFNEVVEIAKQSKGQYQHLYTVLLNEHNHLMSMKTYTSPNAKETHKCIVLPPLEKKEKKRKLDVTNYSSMRKGAAMKKGKQARKCKVCKEMNRFQPDHDRHRAGSSKCPFYKQH